MKKNFIYYVSYVVCMSAALLALGAMCAGSAEAIPASSEKTYALMCEVVELDKTNDTVTVEDYNGNLWSFVGVEDWAIDDTCAMVMNDKGTESIYDDEVINVRFEGWKISK